MTFGDDETLGTAQRRLRAALEDAGVPEPALDARVLLRLATGLDGASLAASAKVRLGARAAARLGDVARRRLGREPVGRIAGWREFWGMPFSLSHGTLEPRPDTEAVVEAALAALPDPSAPLRILDLGTGSGCLLVALLAERPAAWGLGLDLSGDAVLTARRNADANGVGARAAFAVGRWAEAVGAPFDLVVANPPYIRHTDIATLAPEVAGHDPLLALDGGRDGLDAYSSIFGALGSILPRRGIAVLEIGHDQAADVGALARRHGLLVRVVRQDLGGRDRAVVISAST